MQRTATKHVDKSLLDSVSAAKFSKFS